MSPEQEAHLRYLMRKSRQLPQSMEDLLRHVRGKSSKFVSTQPSLQAQARAQQKQKPIEVSSPVEQPKPIPSPEPQQPKIEPKSQYSKDDALTELGLDPNASITAIRKAYLKKALTHHPDKGGDPEVFKRIKKAYDFLTQQE